MKDVAGEETLDEETLERAQAFFRLPPTTLSAPGFWHVYYSGTLNSLSREPLAQYHGDFDQYSPGQMIPRQQPFMVSMGELKAYDFVHDFRFLMGPQATVGLAIAAALRAPTMNEDCFINQRQLVLAKFILGEDGSLNAPYALERARIADCYSQSDIGIHVVLRLLDQVARDPHGPASSGPSRYGDLTLLIKTLALSPPSSAVAPTLIDLVNSTEGSDIKALAVWALGRNGGALAADPMISWLGDQSLDHLAIEVQRALQFLGTGSELLPILYTQGAQAHWASLHESVFRNTEEVDKNSAESVFWEKRLRAALWGPSRYLPALSTDEVPLVRSVAGARLVRAPT